MKIAITWICWKIIQFQNFKYEIIEKTERNAKCWTYVKSCRSRQELSIEYLVRTCKNRLRYSTERAVQSLLIPTTSLAGSKIPLWWRRPAGDARPPPAIWRLQIESQVGLGTRSNISLINCISGYTFSIFLFSSYPILWACPLICHLDVLFQIETQQTKPA